MASVLLPAVLGGCGNRTAQNRDAGKDALTTPAPTDAGAETSVVMSPGFADAGGPSDEDLPPSNPPEFTTRLQHLFEAISQNKPELAADILFPRDAFLAAKDVGDPARLWEQKVLLNFSHDVSQLHKKIHGSDRVEIQSFEIGHAVTQVVPKKHDFKKQLWRVKKSKVTYLLNGKHEELWIAEMTSWRGAWYVTNLR